MPETESSSQDESRELTDNGDSSGFEDCEVCGGLTDELPIPVRAMDANALEDGRAVELRVCEECQLALWSALKGRLGGEKLPHEAAWGELNAALHGKRDAASVGQVFGGEGVSDDLSELIETFDEIAEKHGVESFEECWVDE